MEQFKMKDLLKEIRKYKIFIIIISIIIAVIGSIFNFYYIKKTNYVATAEVVIRYNDLVSKDNETVRLNQQVIQKINSTYIYFLNKKTSDKASAETIESTDVISITSKDKSKSEVGVKINSAIAYANDEIQKIYKNNIEDIILLNDLEIKKSVEVNNIYIVSRILIYLMVGIILSICIVIFKYCLNNSQVEK